MDINGHMSLCEDYVSFETAKLLKEKGFNESTPVNYFVGDDKLRGCVVGEMIHHKKMEEDTHLIACPTLQMAMKWLREAHSLEIYPYHNDPTIINSKWWFEIIKWPNSSFEYESEEDEEFDTYEEACESAINYCLKNLI